MFPCQDLKNSKLLKAKVEGNRIKDKIIEDNIIQDVRNLFRLKHYKKKTKQLEAE